MVLKWLVDGIKTLLEMPRRPYFCLIIITTTQPPPLLPPAAYLIVFTHFLHHGQVLLLLLLHTKLVYSMYLTDSLSDIRVRQEPQSKKYRTGQNNVRA